MLKGFLFVFFTYIGKFLIYLGYGSKGMKARKTFGIESSGLSVFFSILTFIWLPSCLFYSTFANSKDAVLNLVILIACPLIYLVWFLFARINARNLIAEAERITTAPPPTTSDHWVCKHCDTENSNNYSMCKKCGQYRS